MITVPKAMYGTDWQPHRRQAPGVQQPNNAYGNEFLIKRGSKSKKPGLRVRVSPIGAAPGSRAAPPGSPPDRDALAAGPPARWVEMT
eukprot:COSAG04_NODE_502_length_13354_cov_548.289777_17_plen_87_part_00